MATTISESIDSATDTLARLKAWPISRYGYIDETNPDEMQAMLDLATEAAKAFDAVFAAIVSHAGLAQSMDSKNRGERSDGQDCIVSDALEANVAFSLKYELEKLIDAATEDHPANDPNADHRLGARQLGVGGRW